MIPLQPVFDFSAEVGRLSVVTGETSPQASTSQTVATFGATRWPGSLRRHQRQALDALDRTWQPGRCRAWVVLPPEEGKTLVGLKAARRLGRRRVVLSPNTAIVPAARAGRRAAARALLSGKGQPAAVVYHAVPSVMGTNADWAQRFAAAWSTWVSPSDVVRASTPEGEGILVAARGADPTDATTALRVAWQ